MTRATAGILSVLCLTSGTLMVVYSLTADIEAQLDTTPAFAMRSEPFVERPFVISEAPRVRSARPHADRVAFTHRRVRR